MSANPFGKGMDYHIRSVLNGIKQIGGGEGCINNYRNMDFFGHLLYGQKVGNPE